MHQLQMWVAWFVLCVLTLTKVFLDPGFPVMCTHAVTCYTKNKIIVKSRQSTNIHFIISQKHQACLLTH